MVYFESIGATIWYPFVLFCNILYYFVSFRRILYHIVSFEPIVNGERCIYF